MALNTEYDIVKAFDAIENELMSSMIRNMKRHKVEEIDEDKQWAMWQAEQLKALEKYRRNNQKKFGSEFKKINNKVDALIRVAQSEGQMDQELAILKAIKNGFKGHKVSSGASAEFFRLNERKLEALIDSVNNDLQKAETAVLRMANDQYRKIIYNAQVYANTGAGTYEKAVDMATKDFLAAGLNCVEYSNGARHTLKDYAEMAIRTASKRAYLQGEGVKRQEWGIYTVIVNKRGNPCPKCLPFCGKVLIDDVWSGGSKKDGKYPLMSYAVSQGLYHPRCKDSHTTYFPGISTADDTWTEKELDAIGLNAKMEAKRLYSKRQAEKYDRLAKNSLDADNKRIYQNKAEQWEAVIDRESRDELNKSEGAHGIMGEFVQYDEDADFVVDIPYYSEKVNNGLSESVRKVAKYGSEHKHEYSAIIDISTGLEVDFGTSEEYGSVNYYYKFLREHLDGKYIMVHNHNTHTQLSLPDMQELAMWENLEGVISVSNDGYICCAISNGEKSNDYLFSKYKEGDYGIDTSKSEIEQEIHMVDLAAKEFAKGGILIYGK